VKIPYLCAAKTIRLCKFFKVLNDNKQFKIFTIMKKLVLFAGVLVAVSFASCNGAKEKAAEATEAATETVEAAAEAVDSIAAEVDSTVQAVADTVKAAI
jgi:hypothetical protein